MAIASQGPSKTMTWLTSGGLRYKNLRSPEGIQAVTTSCIKIFLFFGRGFPPTTPNNVLRA